MQQFNRLNRLPHHHSFDFKVNVDYHNGNVTLQGPNSCPPPSNINFNNQYQKKQRQSHISQKNSALSFDPFNRKIWKSQTQISTASNNRHSQMNSQPVTQIESMDIGVQCVICNRKYSPKDFTAHLQIHKNRTRKSEPTLQMNQSLSQNYNENPIRYHPPQTQSVKDSQHCIYQTEEYSFQNKEQNSSRQSSKQSSFHLPRQISYMPIQEQTMTQNRQSYSQEQSFYRSESSQHQSRHQSSSMKSSNANINSHMSLNNSRYHQYDGSGPRESQINHGDNQCDYNLRDFSKSSSFAMYRSNQFQYLQQDSSRRSQNHEKLLNFNQGSFDKKIDESIQEPLPIFTKSPFKKKKQIQKNNASYMNKEASDSESSYEDIRDTLENINRNQMIALSQSIRSSMHSKRGPETNEKNAHIFPGEDYPSKRYQSCGQPSFDSYDTIKKQLSMNQLKMKGIEKSQIFRGVQVSAQQIETQLKQSKSSTSKSSKTKLPKNALAIMDHLKNNEAEINQSVKNKQLRSIKSLK